MSGILQASVIGQPLGQEPPSPPRVEGGHCGRRKRRAGPGRQSGTAEWHVARLACGSRAGLAPQSPPDPRRPRPGPEAPHSRASRHERPRDAAGGRASPQPSTVQGTAGEVPIQGGRGRAGVTAVRPGSRRPRHCPGRFCPSRLRRIPAPGPGETTNPCRPRSTTTTPTPRRRRRRRCF